MTEVFTSELRHATGNVTIRARAMRCKRKPHLNAAAIPASMLNRPWLHLRRLFITGTGGNGGATGLK
jgi:hypothetical protein